jgi:hypothetical protein
MKLAEVNAVNNHVETIMVLVSSNIDTAAAQVVSADAFHLKGNKL